jgi:hypothetical protein
MTFPRSFNKNFAYSFTVSRASEKDTWQSPCFLAQPFFLADAGLLQDLPDQKGIDLPAVRIGYDLPIASPFHIRVTASRIRTLKTESLQFSHKL